MKKIIYPLLFLAGATILMFCTKQNPLDSDEDVQQKADIDLAVSVLFKSNAVAASPDSVDSLRFTVQYGSTFQVYTFSFTGHGGKVTGVPARTAFSLKIEGIDRAGNVIYFGLQQFEGAEDDLTIRITANEVSPRAPSNLRLEALTSTSVRLDWTDNSSNEVGFIVERSALNDSHFTAIDTTISNLTATVDNSGLSAGTIYYYRVAAYNPAGKSGYLMAQSVQTLNILRIDSIPPVLAVDSLSDSVKIDSLVVSGRVYDSSGILVVLVNGDTALLGSDSSFSAKIGLHLGRDTITVRAVDNTTRKNDTTATLYVVYNPAAVDNTPPIITVSSPPDSDTVATLTPSLNGTVNDVGSGIDSFKVNNVKVTPAPVNWNTQVSFSAVGWNKVYFAAWDGSGNAAYDTMDLFVDTTTPDVIKPTIAFSISNGHMTDQESLMVTVTVTDNGTVDSVKIGSRLATQAGSQWSARALFTPDSNKVFVEAWDRAGNRGRDSVRVILNRAPRFTVTTSDMTNQVILGATYKDSVFSTDPDGGMLTYSMPSRPADMYINILLGTIAWTPVTDTTVRCSVVVADKYQYRDTLVWTVIVVDTITQTVVTADSMIAISGGTFQMGSTFMAREQPIHSVAVGSFSMSNTEVTQGEYFRVMGINPSNFSGDMKRPVEMVTWYDAVLYCNGRSKLSGKDTVYVYSSILGVAGNGCTGLGNLTVDFSKNGYRLPTEAEWEFACRAGSTAEFYWGQGYPPVTSYDSARIDSYAVWKHNSGGSTAVVGTKIPNAFGLYDVSGNVYTWCNDWFGNYGNGPDTNPVGPQSGTYKVTRGGSWDPVANILRSACRDDGLPSDRNIYLGIRVVIHPLLSVKKIKLSCQPYRMVVSEDSNQLWICSWANGKFVGVDLLRDTVFAETYCLDNADGPVGICYNKFQGPKIYSALRGNGRDGTQMAKIDLSSKPYAVSNLTVNLNPLSCITHPENEFVYVSHETAKNIIEYSVSSQTTSRTINPSMEIGEMRMSDDGNKIFALAYVSNQLKIINTSSFTVVATLDLGARPRNLYLDKQGGYGYIVFENSNTIIQFNAMTNQLVGQFVQVGNNLANGVVSDDGTNMYVTSWGNNRVYKINVSTKTVLDSLETLSNPYDILIHDNRLIVGTGADSSIYLIKGF